LEESPHPISRVPVKTHDAVDVRIGSKADISTPAGPHVR